MGLLKTGRNAILGDSAAARVWDFTDGTGAPEWLDAVLDPSAQLGGSAATAASANNVTLTPDANKTAYLTQVEITGNGATARGDIQVTITGVKGGTRNYWLNIPAGATTPITPDPLTLQFKQPLAGNAPGQAIVVNVPSFGSGNAQAAVNATGFQI